MSASSVHQYKCFSLSYKVSTIFSDIQMTPHLSSQTDVSSVYGEEDNRFLFNNVVVGRRAKARFKLFNTQKVPCDVTLAIKPLAGKFSNRTVECFEIESALKMQIAAHSHTYATVVFTPTGK